jgi:hypothetical protein
MHVLAEALETIQPLVSDLESNKVSANIVTPHMCGSVIDMKHMLGPAYKDRWCKFLETQWAAPFEEDGYPQAAIDHYIYLLK